MLCAVSFGEKPGYGCAGGERLQDIVQLKGARGMGEGKKWGKTARGCGVGEAIALGSKKRQKLTKCYVPGTS